MEKLHFLCSLHSTKPSFLQKTVRRMNVANKYKNMKNSWTKHFALVICDYIINPFVHNVEKFQTCFKNLMVFIFKGKRNFQTAHQPRWRKENTIITYSKKTIMNQQIV